MSNVIDINAQHPLVGSWQSCEGFSDIEITIGLLSGKPSVSVVDKHDGEEPEISQLMWDPDQNLLQFSTLWSTGRLVKYQIRPAPKPGRASVTFTYTDQEVWERL